MDTTITLGALWLPSGIAITPDGTRAYVTNGFTGTVSVINTGSDTVMGMPITVGTNPASVAITPDGTKAYVTNYTSRTVSVITTSSGSVGTPITLSPMANPTGIVVSPSGTLVLVSDETNEFVSVVSTATDMVIDTIYLGTNADPQKIAFSPDGTRAYVAARGLNRLLVLDLGAGTVSSQTLLTGTFPSGVATTTVAGNQRAYVTNANVVTPSVSLFGLDAAPVITTVSLPNGTVGTSYSATIVATGAPAPVFSVGSGLPPGMALNATTGVLSGTPTTTGTYTFTVAANSTVSGIPMGSDFSYTVMIAAAATNGGGSGGGGTSGSSTTGSSGSGTLASTGFGDGPALSMTGLALLVLGLGAAFSARTIRRHRTH